MDVRGVWLRLEYNVVSDVVGRDAHVTLLVDGVPLRIEPIRDLVFRPLPILCENEDEYDEGYSLSFEIEHEDGVLRRALVRHQLSSDCA
jgi:hypothetical protein